MNSRSISKVLFLVVLFYYILPGYNLAHAAPHTPGTNVINNGTVYMIADGQRRAYTSAGAFLSYGFNSWSSVVPANSDDLALPEGNFIPPRDGKIVCSDRGSDKGTCYLITNGKRSAFVSSDIFTKLGFSFGKALYGDVSFLEKDSDITSSTDQHKPGVLINKDGTIYLISSSGLMGIPNPDILRTWGYSFSDAVVANEMDKQIPEHSVITPREGSQLKPNDISTNATEDIILKSYLNSYPALPTTTVSSPDDVAAILTLNEDLSSDATLVEAYPHLSAFSKDLLSRLPTLKKYLESNIYGLYDAEPVYENVIIYEGKQKALLTETITQQLSGYSFTANAIFVKESGIWKVDILGTMKQQIDRAQAENPSDVYFSGNGSTNLSIVWMEYEQDPVKINDSETRFLMGIKNNGQTIVYKYVVEVYINNTNAYTDVVYYKLLPGQEIHLSLPVDQFWNSNVIRPTGQYRTDAAVSIVPANAEQDLSDNIYYNIYNFVQ